jgi:chromosome segregation ATPase
MADFNTRIVILEKEIRANEGIIGEDYRRIGELVYNNPPEGVREELAPSFEEADTRKESLDKVRETIDAIGHNIERQQEIRDRLKEQTAEVREIEQENEPIFEAIGEAAFAQYKKNPFIDQRYANIFTEMVRIQDELSETEDEIRRAEAELERKPFFEKIVQRGRLALLRNRHGNKLSAMPGLFREIGRAVCESDFVEAVDSEDLRQTVQPYQRNEQRRRTLEANNRELERELETLGEEMRELTEDAKPERAITKAESEEQLRKDALQEQFQAIGLAFRDSSAASQPPKSIKPVLDEINELEKANAEKAKLINRLNSAIEVEHLEKSINEMKDTISLHEKQIEESRETISRLESEIESADKKKAEEEKKRGDLSSLSVGS